ncbi:MAG: S24 family peptidase [Bryobacteraceae bacterium]|nr:S24 family peptidase [Bryobacteraceae bacterium]
MDPIPFPTARPGMLSVLEADLPSRGAVPIGVLLEDPATDRLYVRMRRDFDRWAAPEDAEVLELMAEGLESAARECGASALIHRFEDGWSNALRIRDREPVTVPGFERGVEQLYRRHVQSEIRPYITHVPRFGLAVAAGSFLDNGVVEGQEPESWEEADGRKLTPQHFAARISGRSMEPVIPDGSVCLFRFGVAGSRDGRLVLVQETARQGEGAFTVKRYRSSKIPGPEGGWSHQIIRLEPLNPEFEAWELLPDEDRYRVLAEFLEVLY